MKEWGQEEENGRGVEGGGADLWKGGHFRRCCVDNKEAVFPAGSAAVVLVGIGSLPGVSGSGKFHSCCKTSLSGPVSDVGGHARVKGEMERFFHYLSRIEIMVS